MFVRAAVQSNDPNAGLKAMDEVLAGRNTEANRAFAGLFEEATAGMSTEHKDQVAAIGRDLSAMARKDAARAPAQDPVSTDRALQARKDLTAMGLRYYDAAQFLDAVRRDDALAAELFLHGRGVNPSAKGADGRTALDIARANGNEPLASLISRNLPAAR
jgi:ankyrin repeat protein